LLRVWDGKIREGKASAIADPANPYPQGGTPALEPSLRQDYRD